MPTSATLALTLRDATTADIPALFALQEESGSVELAAIKRRSREAFDEHWRHTVLASPETTKKIIELAGELVGYVVAWCHDEQREVGYWIARAHFGRGIATQALQRFVKEYETQRPLHAVIAAHNYGSMKVAARVGFVRTHLLVEPDGIEVTMWRLD